MKNDQVVGKEEIVKNQIERIDIIGRAGVTKKVVMIAKKKGDIKIKAGIRAGTKTNIEVDLEV